MDAVTNFRDTFIVLAALWLMLWTTQLFAIYLTAKFNKNVTVSSLPLVAAALFMLAAIWTK